MKEKRFRVFALKTKLRPEDSEKEVLINRGRSLCLPFPLHTEARSHTFSDSGLRITSAKMMVPLTRAAAASLPLLMLFSAEPASCFSVSPASPLSLQAPLRASARPAIRTGRRLAAGLGLRAHLDPSTVQHASDLLQVPSSTPNPTRCIPWFGKMVWHYEVWGREGVDEGKNAGTCFFAVDIWCRRE